jgi:WhiB family redox-sensing transcriptional regulator
MDPHNYLRQAIDEQDGYVPCQNAPDLFFPPDEHKQQRINENYYQPAKTLCALCPIQLQCLEYALTTNQTDGVWGGTTPQERKRHHKKQNLW